MAARDQKTAGTNACDGNQFVMNRIGEFGHFDRERSGSPQIVSPTRKIGVDSYRRGVGKNDLR